MRAFTIEDFLATVGASSRTIDHYRKILRALETWSGGPLESLTAARLETLKTQLRTMRSGHHYVLVLRMYLKAARKTELRDRAVLKQRTRRLRPDEILTVPEIQQLIDATKNTRDRALVACLYETGVRVSELLALNLADVARKDVDGGPRIYVLWFHTTKTDGTEHQGFVVESMPVFEAWLKSHPYRSDPEAPLFTDYRGRVRMSRIAAWHVVTDAAAAAQLGKHVWPHLFRHSRATHLLARGVPETQVRKLLGWVPGSSMLSRYAHLTNADAEAALLKSEGFQVPATIDVGRLAFQDEQLRPIVPVESPPSKGPPIGAIPEAVWDLLDNPRVAELLHRRDVQDFLAALSDARPRTSPGPAAPETSRTAGSPRGRHHEDHHQRTA